MTSIPYTSPSIGPSTLPITRRHSTSKTRSLSPSSIASGSSGFSGSSGSVSSSKSTVRYSPYVPFARLSLSSEEEGDGDGDGSDAGSGSGPGSSSEMENSNTVASLRQSNRASSSGTFGRRRSSRHGGATASQQRTRAKHRRTISLGGTSYGYMLLPQGTETIEASPMPSSPIRLPNSSPAFHPPTLPYHHPLALAAPDTPQSRDVTLSPTPEEPAPTPAPLSPTKLLPLPTISARRAVPPPIRTQQRLVLVNPAIAAHLKRGGAVSVKSVDGARSWKVFLPVSPAKTA